MKKLLSITGHLSTGGAPQVLVKRVELIKNDIEVYVVEYSNVSDHFVIQKNRLKKLLKPDHFFTLGENKFELLDIIKKINPDYIHFEEMPEFFMDYNLAKEIYKENRSYRIFETTHSSDYNVDDKKFFPDKFLFVSQYNSFKFNKFGIPTEVIEYPVEKRERPNPERKLELQKKLGLDPNKKHVVNVGLFTRRKNQGYAFEIARQMENDMVQFHFIGNQAGNFEDYWKPLMKNVPKNVKLWGERDDVYDFYDACDLFLFTSRGFRYDKELNPLVIKEALEHQIPQFIFPLDVYNRKYDIENDTIHYLFGDIEIDAGLVRNFLFPREYFTKRNDDTKPKIRAVHLLLDEDDRASESIKEMEKLKEYGIDYVQHINKRFTGNPPKEFCARPWDVGRLGSYSLRGPHYGNYTSFRKAILTEFTNDVDYLMIMESDCKLTVPIQEFVDKLYESCKYINMYNIHYMSYGDKRNLRTGEVVSDVVENTSVPWMYVTNKIIGIQCIMFPKSIKHFIQRAYETVLWDVSDLYFNDVFKYKRKGIAPGLTTQIEGVSTIQGENITHFLLKNEHTLLKDKNPNDIVIEFMEDKRFHIVLSDFFQNDIANIKANVSGKDGLLYSTVFKGLSPHRSNWISINNWETHDKLYFDFEYNDTYLFRKEVVLKNNTETTPPPIPEVKNEIQPEPQIPVDIKIEEKENVIKNVSFEEIIDIVPENFLCEFNKIDNKINIFYSNNNPSKFKVLVTDIDSDFPIFSKEMEFNKEFFNWVVPSHINLFNVYPKFNGFNFHFIDIETNTEKFKKELRLRNGTSVCKYKFNSDHWEDKDKYYEIFHEEGIYKDLKISNKDELVINFTNDYNLFLIYAIEKGAKSSIGIDFNQRTYRQDMSDKISIYDRIPEQLPEKISLIVTDNYKFKSFNDDVIQKTERILLEYDTHENLLQIVEKLNNLGFIEINKTHNSSYFVKKENVPVQTQRKPQSNGEDLWVVLTYPDTKIKEKVTTDCLKNIRSYSDKKILVTSHYPMTKELQDLSDFYLYDSYNPLIEHTLYKFYWSDMENVKVELNLDKLQNVNRLNQSLVVLNNIENAVRFSKEAGYKRIICCSYDFIFNEENIKQVDSILNQLNENGKKGYFMSYKEGDMSLLKTVFFIIDVDFYSQIFTNPRTPEKYNEECRKMGCHNFLENYFKNKLSGNLYHLMVEETDEEKLFNNPSINLFSGVEYLTVIPVKNQSAFVLWYNSSNKWDDRRIVFTFENNGQVENHTHMIKDRCYYYRKFEVDTYDNWKIKAVFVDSKSNEKINEVNFQIDKDSFINILGNGLFTEKV